jgi:hypothetical protein
MILAEELADVQLLPNLDEPHVNQIARLAWPMEYPEGAVIFREGQGSPFIYCRFDRENQSRDRGT